MVLICGLLLAYFILVPGSGSTPAPTILNSVGVKTIRGVVFNVGCYGLFSGSLGVLCWLVNWRFSAKNARAITNGGLRWWKECIGASICVLAWIYLGIALMAWPAGRSR